MEVFMHNVPFVLNERQMESELEPFLHGPRFECFNVEALFNFHVLLYQDHRGRSSNKHRGCGLVTVPSTEIGEQLISIGELTIRERLVKLKRNKRTPDPERIAFVQRSYIEVAADREAALRGISSSGSSIAVSSVQFVWRGWHNASIEWEDATYGWELRLDEVQNGILLRNSKTFVFLHYSSVRMLEHDEESILIRYSTHPILEGPLDVVDSEPLIFPENATLEERFILAFRARDQLYRAEMDLGPSRKRLHNIDSDHALIAPYVNTIRLFLSPSRIQDFRRKVRITHCNLTYYSGPSLHWSLLFQPDSLEIIIGWFQSIDFVVAFQCEAILAKGLLSPEDFLTEVIPQVEGMMTTSPMADVAATMRNFASILNNPDTPMDQSITGSLSDAMVKTERQAGAARRTTGQNRNQFMCHHVTITPTAQLLSGPTPEQTNRVLRWYPDFHDNFIRVDLKEEDRLALRWNKEVDGESFVKERFGSVLKGGINVAGRHFDFLAYSQSALREHAVWFMTPFRHDGRIINADSIRYRLGDFTKVIHCPARYAARMSQAFSSTDSSLVLQSQEIQMIPDKLATDGSNFTDGVGRMSPDVAADIYAVSNPSSWDSNIPTQYQVRIGGSKGMLSVDWELAGSRIVQIRESMQKFDAPDSLDIEISRVFDHPTPAFLNRPLIMLLETLGIHADIFMELQANVMDAAHEASESLFTAGSLLEAHGLGAAFNVRSMFLNLASIGAELDPQDRYWDFTRQTIDFSITHIYRELKYRARIPIPGSWLLVGVADEHEELTERFVEGHGVIPEIYACLQQRGGQKEYISGPVFITRSPTIAPGDAQMVWAIGEPDPHRYLFLSLNSLTNCVVFPCTGARSLPSMLSGGDLDGDEYMLILDERLHPPQTAQPLNYDPPVLVKKTEPSTIDDVSDFVVDYINNDLLGIIATQQLQIADKSTHCLRDPKCMELAELHSIAVDFPKTGRSVKFNDLPRLDSDEKPDWMASETADFTKGYYESNRILGQLFRAVELYAIQEARRVSRKERRFQAFDTDRELQNMLSELTIAQVSPTRMAEIFGEYARQLRSITEKYSISGHRPLTEAEIVAGTIVAKCSQPRLRKNLISKLREESTILVGRVRDEIMGEDMLLQTSLMRAWAAWNFSDVDLMSNKLGAKSFGVIALGIIFETVTRIENTNH